MVERRGCRFHPIRISLFADGLLFEGRRIKLVFTLRLTSLNLFGLVRTCKEFEYPHTYVHNGHK